jgi:hypothetical protein
MATILEFPHARLRPGTEGVLTTPAEIVIFPGVRIERSDFKLSDRLTTGRRRKSQKSEIGNQKTDS